MLYQEKITTVTHVLCMWEGNHIDVPSHKFVTTLCKINSENKDAEVLLKSSPDAIAYIAKKLSEIIG